MKHSLRITHLGSVLAGALILLCACTEARAAERQLRLAWTDLAPNVTGRRISTVLTDGAMLEGRVVLVKGEALVVEVKKTSAPTRFRGTADVPRELVSTLRVSRSGWKWRVIGSVAGLFGGASAGGLIGDSIDPKDLAGGFTDILIGGFAGASVGYLIGHFADHHSTMIQIVR